MKMRKYLCSVLPLIMVAGMALAQEARDSVRWYALRNCLDTLAKTDPVYMSAIDLSVGKLPLGELLRNVAQVNGVNLCVKADGDIPVTCNFKWLKIKDLLFYLCQEYDLEIEVIGNIVSVSSPLPVALPRKVNVVYDSLRQELSYDLQDETLMDVVREISRLTGEKIIVPQELYRQKVSGFSYGLPIAQAISALAVSNHLETEHQNGKIWNFLSTVSSSSQKASYQPRHSFMPDQVRVDSSGRVFISVNRGNIQDLVAEVCRQASLDRMFLAPLEGQVSLYVSDLDIPSLFNVLFAGTPFSYREEKGVYLFGLAGQQKVLSSAVVIPLRFRTVEHIPELIPESLKNGVQLQVYPEQNSLIVSGDSRQIALVRDFVNTIDRSVPLITIEVMIVDSKKSAIQEVGMTAGLGENPVKTRGQISPGVDFTLSAASVNKLIHSFNGFGSVNLGRVTPNFYLTLKALEQAGSIELRSTPKLSTLNGHEASLKSGETRYYKEVQNNIMGTQNPIQSESYIWKSIEANLDLKIIPFVSQDGKITLSIEIEQSEFTAREEKDAPPGTAIRSFKSQIKVNNEEMVLLGGIDRNSREKGSKGLPFIARIPVLKWIFGTSTHNKVDEKLSVFIKPTVIF